MERLSRGDTVQQFDAADLDDAMAGDGVEARGFGIEDDLAQIRPRAPVAGAGDHARKTASGHARDRICAQRQARRKKLAGHRIVSVPWPTACLKLAGRRHRKARDDPGTPS